MECDQPRLRNAKDPVTPETRTPRLPPSNGGARNDLAKGLPTALDQADVGATARPARAQTMFSPDVARLAERLFVKFHDMSFDGVGISRACGKQSLHDRECGLLVFLATEQIDDHAKLAVFITGFGVEHGFELRTRGLRITTPYVHRGQNLARFGVIRVELDRLTQETERFARLPQVSQQLAELHPHERVIGGEG